MLFERGCCLRTVTAKFAPELHDTTGFRIDPVDYEVKVPVVRVVMDGGHHLKPGGAHLCEEHMCYLFPFFGPTRSSNGRGFLSGLPIREEGLTRIIH